VNARRPDELEELVAYNIADLFEHAVDYLPERLALACGDDEMTYAQLEEQANRLAHHLAAHSVAAGSHVGMCTRNRLQAIVTMLAVYKLRAALINVNYRYTANEIRNVLHAHRQHQSGRHLPGHARGGQAGDRRGSRLDRQHLVGRGAGRHAVPDRLHLDQVRDPRHDQGGRTATRPELAADGGVTATHAFYMV
jgi:hypothetical protein